MAERGDAGDAGDEGSDGDPTAGRIGIGASARSCAKTVQPECGSAWRGDREAGQRLQAEIEAIVAAPQHIAGDIENPRTFPRDAVVCRRIG
jgi:hypothetical protein